MFGGLRDRAFFAAILYRQWRGSNDFLLRLLLLLFQELREAKLAFGSEVMNGGVGRGLRIKEQRSPAARMHQNFLERDVYS